MWAYILKRLLLMIPTLFGILLITFIVIQFVPGGPVEQMVAQLQGRDAGGGEVGARAAAAPGLGGYRGRQGVDAAKIEEIKKLYGFDKPPHQRFIQMLGQFARFDLGRSFFHNKDVWQLITENSVLEEVRKQYVMTARAKGVAERKVLWRHVFRNALIPIMTGFPAAFVAAFFTGSLLIETLFSLDGLGLLSYESVIRRDYPVVFGSLFVYTIIGLLTNLIRDLTYVWVDPRVKFE